MSISAGMVLEPHNGVISENIRYQQQKIVKCNHLVANMVILHNVEMMSLVFNDMADQGDPVSEELAEGLSPYRLGNLNRFGQYSVDLSRKSEQIAKEVRHKICEENIVKTVS